MACQPRSLHSGRCPQSRLPPLQTSLSCLRPQLGAHHEPLQKLLEVLPEVKHKVGHAM